MLWGGVQIKSLFYLGHLQLHWIVIVTCTLPSVYAYAIGWTLVWLQDKTHPEYESHHANH